MAKILTKEFGKKGRPLYSAEAEKGIG